METFSNIKLFSIFFLLYLVTTISAQSHDVTIGNCTNTEPVFSQVIHKKNDRFWWFSKEEYTFKYNGIPGDPRPISCITVKDLQHDGNGGYGKLMRGGPSLNFTEIRFRSQSGGTIDFVVTIYVARRTQWISAAPIPMQPQPQPPKPIYPGSVYPAPVGYIPVHYAP